MKTRIIHTRIWTDSFFESLSPQEKLLFIFLITNENIGLTGAYECSDRAISFHTGLSQEQIVSCKKKLIEKFGFVDGWVYIKNAGKYTNYASTDMMKRAYQREYQTLPNFVKKFVPNVNESVVPSEYPQGTTPPSINNKSEIINNKTKSIKTDDLNVEKQVKDVLKAGSGLKYTSTGDRKELANKMDMNAKKSGIHTQWQDDAFRFAEQLGIKLDDVSLKGRWLKFFKTSYERKLSNKIKTTYSTLVDYAKFQSIETAEGKVKYFFAVFSKP